MKLINRYVEGLEEHIRTSHRRLQKLVEELDAAVSGYRKDASAKYESDEFGWASLHGCADGHEKAVRHLKKIVDDMEKRRPEHPPLAMWQADQRRAAQPRIDQIKGDLLKLQEQFTEHQRSASKHGGLCAITEADTWGRATELLADLLDQHRDIFTPPPPMDPADERGIALANLFADMRTKAAQADIEDYCNTITKEVA